MKKIIILPIIFCIVSIAFSQNESQYIVYISPDSSIDVTNMLYVLPENLYTFSGIEPIIYSMNDIDKMVAISDSITKEYNYKIHAMTIEKRTGTIKNETHNDPDPEKFNITYFILEALGGTLLSGGLSLGTGLAIASNIKDDKGIATVVGTVLTFAITNPFTVYLVGEVLNNPNGVTGKFMPVFFSSAFASSISYGSLGPVGAAFAYEISKQKIVIIEDEKLDE